MKELHLISGLPRSGSTLLCQMLNMNPKFTATATSPVLDMLVSMQHVFSHNGGYKAVDRLGHYDQFADAQKAYLETWYAKSNIVFDKNRGWPMNLMKLDEILDNEDTKVIWTYRHPMDVIASMEKRHRQFPLIQYVEEVQQAGIMATLDSRIAAWIGDNSIITVPARALHEAMHTGYKDRIKIIDYKKLCTDPQQTMDDIHEFLGIEKYDYAKKDWKDLKQVTFEHDNLYNYKFPHQIVEGGIKYVENDLEELEVYKDQIAKRYEWLIKTVGTQLSKDNNQRVSRKERNKKAPMKKSA